MRYAAIIAAGGIGKRFGKAQGKQFFEYKHKPIIIHTIEKFIDQVDQIIIVIKEDQIELLKDFLVKHQIFVDQIVAGGSERYDSVKNGLAVLGNDIDGVLIHDGDRPNISQELINSLKGSLEKYDAVIPVLPVVDTIKVVRDNKVAVTPKRSELYRVQTPQGFKKDLINNAYAEVDFAGCTDDAMVVERYGHEIQVVAGDPDNLKITTPEDLKYIK